jgi:hypothetical protein
MKSGVLMLDCMARLFWSSEIYWLCACDTFEALLNRFKSEAPIQKFAIQFVRISNKKVFAEESGGDMKRATKVAGRLYEILARLNS